MKSPYEDDLRWFFNNAYTSCGGPRSNFHVAMSGLRTLDFELSDAELDAVARERRIRHVLSRLPLHDCKILAAYYTAEEERCCPMLRVIYGEYLRVARILHTRDSLSNIRKRNAHDAILADAKSDVRKAIKAYSAAAKEEMS